MTNRPFASLSDADLSRIVSDGPSLMAPRVVAAKAEQALRTAVSQPSQPPTRLSVMEQLPDDQEFMPQQRNGNVPRGTFAPATERELPAALPLPCGHKVSKLARDPADPRRTLCTSCAVQDAAADALRSVLQHSPSPQAILSTLRKFYEFTELPDAPRRENVGKRRKLSDRSPRLVSQNSPPPLS